MNRTMLLAADAYAPIEEPEPLGGTASNERASHAAATSGFEAPVTSEPHGTVAQGASAMLASTYEESLQGATTKTCPVCRAESFLDMDTCYNCMYQFGSSPNLERLTPQTAGAKPSPTLAQSASTQEGRRIGEGVRKARAPLPSHAEESPGGSAANDLLAEVLVELHGFLGQFLLNRGIDVKKL